MNHCPVYCAVGGHAYGSVYAGPIGAVLTPALFGAAEAGHLAEASTFCGRCEEVCPVESPLVRMMRRWREVAFSEPDTAWRRTAMRAWAWLAARPRGYRAVVRPVIALLSAAGRRGAFRHLPLASGWTRHRDFPAPQGGTFQDLWARRQREERS
jgi:L-lactate dehydrogenase complex protein LldF